MKRKEKRYINIGETFEEKNKLSIKGNYKTLFECYKRPSCRKYYIYNYYKELLEKNADRVEKYGISSYNCNFILLEAIITKDNVRYYLYITPRYNYFKELEA